MANRHFAAFGDVWKHLPLAEILRLKPPAHYWETHAGSAGYVLTESSTRLHGAIRFLAMAPHAPVVWRHAAAVAICLSTACWRVGMRCPARQHDRG